MKVIGQSRKKRAAGEVPGGRSADVARGVSAGARTAPPFRADHVGSLLRPAALTEARRDFDAGRIDADGLRRAEDLAVTDVVRMQEEIGLRSVTDGEIRRRSWHMDFIYQLGGVAPAVDAGQAYAFRSRGGTVISAQGAMRVEGKISLDTTIFGEHFAFLRDVVSGAVPKLTIPAPAVIYARAGRAMIDEEVYPDLAEFWSDLTDAYVEQLQRLYDLGCRYLQFDDTSLAELCDEAARGELIRAGEDPDALLAQYVDQLNRVVRARPSDMVVTVHTCRGNYRSAWGAEGSYDAIAEQVFSGLEVDGFFLEYDDDRSGGFEPLRYVRAGCTVVLGLVTSKYGDLESKDELKRRIEKAGRHVSVDQLCLSPQCGFASVDVGNDVTHDQQRAKLQLVVDTAAEVWG